jgi:ubiquinone/menaquinone biosynthesis C-methylase UbiE
MNRVPEPELMDGEEQADAYAHADFDEPNSRFVALFQEAFPKGVDGCVLDLGCGPGDISLRFALVYPACTVHGVDGAENMLKYARAAALRLDLAGRVSFVHGRLPEARLPRKCYDAVISNSLLHHLEDPQVLWESIKRFAAPGAPVFAMDLVRPESRAQARLLVETHAANEPERLKEDFYRSLLAAYRRDEIAAQLEKAGLPHFSTRVVSDRHMIVTGRL